MKSCADCRYFRDFPVSGLPALCEAPGALALSHDEATPQLAKTMRAVINACAVEGRWH